MAVTIDFGTRQLSPVLRPEGDLTELVVNKRYQTPEAFLGGSLIVIINGLVKDRVNDNGYDVLSDDTFELRITKLDKHFLQVQYSKK